VRYPADVADEFATMRAVRDGASLARFGDGELKMMHGAGYVRQAGSPAIAAELRGVLNAPAPGCLVGIPTLHPDGPKIANWLRHRKRFEAVMTRKTGGWYSAFVTRPDSAPWIETPDYFELVTSVWRGRDVVAVCEPSNKLLPVLHATAGTVRHVVCPSEQCYGILDRLFAAVVVHGPPGALAVLCHGVTATVLANRLADAGTQALDFGSGGGLMARLMDAPTSAPAPAAAL
jgi:hypothetical protein